MFNYFLLLSSIIENLTICNNFVLRKHMFKLKLRLNEKPFVKTRFTLLFICASILIIVTKTTKNTNLAVIITLTTFSLIILTVSDIVHNADNRRVPYGRITYKDEKPSFLSLVNFPSLKFTPNDIFRQRFYFQTTADISTHAIFAKTEWECKPTLFRKQTQKRLVLTYFVISL